MKKLLLSLVVPLLLSTPALTAPPTGTPQNEILYRTHLGRADDVKLLLEQGVAPTLTNSKGVPLLALAASRKDPEGIAIMKVLLDAGADINGTDVEGQTALFYAAKHGNKEAALFLLNAGIQYYIVDYNGDIARNLAHREGHKNVLTAMDNFVKGVGEKRKAEYQAYHQAIQDREAEAFREQQAQEEEKKKQLQSEFDAAVAANEDWQEQHEREKENLEQYQQEEFAELMAKRQQSGFEQSLYDLAFNTCAFQYWSYCKSLNQTTEIKDKELTTAIEMHSEKVGTLNNLLRTEYELTQSYLDGVIKRSKKRIFVKLDRMPSKSYRFEHGVGKIQDMHARCEEIAKKWNDKNMPELDEDEEGDSFSDDLKKRSKKKKRRRR